MKKKNLNLNNSEEKNIITKSDKEDNKNSNNENSLIKFATEYFSKE